MSSDHLSPHYASYAFGLDLVRFGCALVVALFHFTWRIPNEAHIMPFGWVGVQVFFVISGVVIANSAIASTPYRFARNRFLRLYPAAWVAAAISFAILSVVPTPAYYALGIGVNPEWWAFASSVMLVGEDALATAYWTLPIEIAFYALVFIALLRGRVRLRAVARLLAVASSAYLVSLFYLLVTTSGPGVLDLGYGLKNMLLLRHGVFFAIGIYLWMATQRQPLDRSDRVLFGLSLAAAALEIVCRSVSLTTIFAAGDAGPLDIRWVTVGALLAFAALLAAIRVCLVNAKRWTPSARTAARIRMLGLVTYPFYLVHEVVGGAMLVVASDRGLGRPAALTLAIVATLAVAWLIAAFAEPALRRAIVRGARWIRGSGVRIGMAPGADERLPK
ncbi:acyltransferase [Massilia sp. CFBP9012]|uniref:acyltransferase family protein n=1 Tax=Massilia sp. CFBP9012 TaxID=3096531 RepID=UPI002A6AD728|nr:acyltransferase [Massilia sp. CFBP9012]MDY0977073.1 acyltransferase [Massilia sp. CFBP9012]